jgi:putative membrane protein
VPEARAQSIGVSQGPLDRLLGLARVHVHTVNGPVRAELGALDVASATRFFTGVSLEVVVAVRTDATHRWRADGGAA